MKRRFVIGMLCVLSALLVGVAWAARNAPGIGSINEPTQAQRQLVVSKLSSMPLAFTENQGQFGEKTKFRCNAPGVTFYFAAGEVAYLFSRETDEPIEKALGPWGGVAGMPESLDRLDRPRYKREGLLVHAKFVGANPNAEVIGEGMLPHKSNYFYGNDPSKWRTNVPNYSAVRYRNIYPGIDLMYYGDDHSLKYDFVVRPGADPSKIEIEYEGVNSLSVNTQGELLISTQFGDVIERVPYVYQEIGGDRRQIPCRYLILDKDRFGFVLDDNYDRSHRLYIDPELLYSTYLGGSDADGGYDVAVDAEGCAYVTGYTWSTDFPTVNPYDGSLNGFADVFVAKLSASGSSLIYSTYLGGNDFDTDDMGISIAVDGKGCAYVTGRTGSTNFPTVNPYDGSYNGLNDAFVTKLSASGNSLVYSTYLGGGYGDDRGFDIAVDSEGCAYVTGRTESPSFPIANPYDGSFNGGCDVFVIKFSVAGDSLCYSTFLGGGQHDEGRDIAVDDEGCAYVTGSTDSPDFPRVNPYDGNLDGRFDAFMTKLSVAGNSLVYSTYLGGSDDDYGGSIAVDDRSCALVTGWTLSSDFPTINSYDEDLSGSMDAFVTKFSETGSVLLYSTYLGGDSSDVGNGIALCDQGYVYVTGWTESSDFPATADAYDTTSNGDQDAFVTKLSVNQPPTAVIDSIYPNPADEGEEVTFVGHGEDTDGSVVGYNWRSKRVLKKSAHERRV